MEFDENICRVVGKIDRELGEKNAKIKVIALVSQENKYTELSIEEAIKKFPPKGTIFEPGFFYNYSNYKINDFISFEVEENERAEYGLDQYKLKYNTVVKSFGVKACRIIGFKRKGLTTDLNTISLDDDIYGDFYGITDKYIIGKLRVKDGKVEQALNHRIQIWDLDEDNLIDIDGQCRLIKESDEKPIVLDCMDDKQLFEWFRSYLKQIQPDYVNLLDHNANWRTELPKMFATVDYERLEADKIRLKRIEEKFDLLELSRKEIISLTEGSENFKKIFKDSLENHIEEFKDKYIKDLDEFKSEIGQKKISLNSQISDLNNQKTSKEKLLNELTESVKLTKEKLNKLENNKDRIIKDFSIIKEVIQEPRNKVNYSKIETDSFVIEDIKNDDFNEVTSIDQFEEELQYQLSENKMNPKFSKYIYNITSLYSVILIKDIRVGLAFAKATNNAKYIIQQVEPDWLHFSDFWNNGLGKIWESAYNLPDTLHFLLLEDINMSALECYCRPLLDIINGIRNNIPYGKTPFPQNLKIFATYTSFNEPAIGLPIYKKTFENCGAIGFRGNIYSTSDIISKRENKFIKRSFLDELVLDDFERDEIRNVVNEEMNKIFEL